MPTNAIRASRRRCAARSVSACLALAASTAMVGTAGGAAYTWTGKGPDANWDDFANWTPATGAPSAPADTATFSGTVTANLPNLDADESIGELIFSTVTGGWTLNDTSGTTTLTLNAVGGIGIDASAQTSGTTTINANLAVGANQAWKIGGGTLLINGLVSSAGANAQYNILTIANGAGGTTVLTANDSYNGYLVVNSGTLQLSGNGQLQQMGSGGGSAQAGLTLNGGTFRVDNTATAISNRLNAGAPASTVTFDGGNMVYVGNAATVVNDGLGDATLAGSVTSMLTVSSTNGAALTLNSLSRSLSGPTLFVNGNNLGLAGGGQVVLTAPPQGVGTTTATNVDTSAKDLSIVPFLVGEVSTGATGAPGASGAGGSSFGTPNTFVALTGAKSLRPLNPIDEFTNDAIVTGNNIYVSTGATASTSTSINSLVINGGNLTIADGQTLNNASGALLFVTNNSISPTVGSSNPGTLDFGGQEGIVSVNTGKIGTIATPISGNNALTVTGNGGTLLLSGISPNFSGAAYINNNTLQFGNGTAGGDGAFTNPGSSIVFSNSGLSALAINNAGAVTMNAAIQYPANGVYAFAYVVGPGALTLNGPLVMNSGPGAPFLFLHGGAGGGPVTINSDITQVGATNQGGSYFYVGTNGGVTFNGNNSSQGTYIYEEGIPTAVVYGGITTPTVGGAIPNIVVTLSSAGQIGNGFTNGVPNPGSPSYFMVVSNINRARTNVLPPPTVFNQNGPINASGGTSAYTTSDGYYAGATIWNVNAPLAVNGNFRTGVGSHLNGANQPAFGILNIAPGQVLDIAPQATNSQTGYFVNGWGLNKDGSYGYIRTGAGAAINADGNESTTYQGYNAHGLLDLTNLNSDGSVGAGSTLNTYFQMLLNGGGSFGGQTSVTDIYPGSTINLYSFGSDPGAYAAQPAILPANGSVVGANGVFTNPSLNLAFNVATGAALGDTAVLNVMGGTVNNANAIDAAHTYPAGLSLYGTQFNDNNNVTAVPTGILNVSNGGAVRTNLIRAETVTFNNALPGNAANFVNFGGFNNGAGELDFNGSGSQGNFIDYGVAGTYVYSGGAKIGTSINNTAFPSNSVTIPQGLMAAPGNGVSGISFNGGAGGIGSGYSAAPIVVVSDSTGFDATAYAVVDTNSADATYGQITRIVVTNPGFNMTGATLKFIGGGGTAPATSAYAVNYTSSTSGFQASGGLIKLDSGTLTLDGTYAGDSTSSAAAPTPTAPSNAISSYTSTGAAALVGQGTMPAVGAGNAGANIRNNTSSYAGPTVIEAGTLALVTSTSPSVAGNTYPATNNNIPYSASIIVGDTSANGGAVLSVAGIGGTGGFQLGPNQVLAGFGKVMGSNSVGVTIGAATTGNNFGGGNGSNGLPAIGSTGGGSIIAPGVSAAMNTLQGNATTTATGALTLTSGATGSPMTTTFGSGGTYYWKLNTSTGGAGATGTPGSPTANGANVNGAAWDAVVLDTLAVSATPSNPFTIQAVPIQSGSGTAVAIGGSNKQSYSWVIARANDGSINAANLLANFALNASAMPAPAYSYGYSLSTQMDPTIPADSDLIVNYAPTPEPTALALLAPAAGAMLLRRRRLARVALHA